MARGYPDYSPGAARSAEGLFLPVIAEPPIYYEDNFDHPDRKWTRYAGTITYMVGLYDGFSGNMSYMGYARLAMTESTTNPVEVGVRLGVPPTITDIGIEIAINLQGDTYYADSTTENRIIDVHLYDGTNYKIARLTLNTHDGKWYVVGPTVSDVNYIGTHALPSQYWMRVKLIFNLTDGYYKRVYVDNDVFDASSYQLYTVTTTSVNATIVKVRLKGGDESSHIAYLGLLRVTYGES